MGCISIPRPLTRHPREPVSPRPLSWPLTSRSHSTVLTLSLHLSLYSSSSLPTETSELSSETHFPASSPPSTHALGIGSLGALALEPTACLSHPTPTPPSQGHNSQFPGTKHFWHPTTRILPFEPGSDQILKHLQVPPAPPASAGSPLVLRGRERSEQGHRGPHG